jgi:murein L,D-transpeptidase YafK
VKKSGYAVIIHGYNRTTGDMDIWVNRTEENYQKITKAFAEFVYFLFYSI